MRSPLCDAMKKLIGKSVMTGQWLVRHMTCYAWVVGDDRMSPPRTRWCLREQRLSAGIVKGDREMSGPLEHTIVDNEVYNLLIVAAEKLQGLAAYNKYEQDGQANSQLWQQLRQQDEQTIRQVLQQLTQFAQQGKLVAK